MHEFKLSETLGIIGTLNESVIEYLEDGKRKRYKSLYVPGVGWCPYNGDYTNKAEKLSLFCSVDEDVSIKTVIAPSHIVAIYNLPNNSRKLPCDRFDIYCYMNGISNKIVARFCSIRGDVECCHDAAAIMGDDYSDVVSECKYFVDLTVKNSHYLVYVTDELLEHIKANGFDDVRIKHNNDFGYAMLVLPKEQMKQYREYDNLLISLNKFNYVPKLKLSGIEPFYFLEDENWRNVDNHNLIQSNKVAETPLEKPFRVRFSDSIEEEINELVDFFSGMGFSSSSEVSNYIREHKLGYRYKRICGYLKLKNGDGEWEFEGGIAPQYYAEICTRLGLDNNGSDAVVVYFESFENRGY